MPSRSGSRSVCASGWTIESCGAPSRRVRARARAAALARARTRRLGAPQLSIVQPDAHTDLLPDRLGIPICFATWSYHANELIGRQGRMVQVGTRASRFPREYWESRLDVRQF